MTTVTRTPALDAGSTVGVKVEDSIFYRCESLLWGVSRKLLMGSKVRWPVLEP